MEDIQIFTGVFLALTLVFLTSLWFKYGDKLAQRDHENCGNCPVHKKQNAKSTNSNSDGVQHDIHSFAKIVDTRPDDKNSIDQAFGIAVQLANAAIKHTSTETQLHLYALYKQCITGDCDRKEPSKLSMADHAKWSAWNALKGKSKLESKREYFQTVYKEIIIALKVEVKLYDTEDQVPENEKKYAKSSGQAPSMDFNVQSKLEAEEFNEELHGSPDELFNKFDLTQRDIDIDAIKQYIGTNKVQLNQRNENGTTFLCFAVDNNHMELVRVLIEEFDADVNIRDDMGYTPLHSAAMTGNSELVSFLIENGADKTAMSTDEDQETPFDLADDEQIKLLLKIEE